MSLVAFYCYWNHNFDSIYQNHSVVNPRIQIYYTRNLIKIGFLVLEIFKFESLGDVQRTMDEGPSLYYKPTWATYVFAQLS